MDISVIAAESKDTFFQQLNEFTKKRLGEHESSPFLEFCRIFYQKTKLHELEGKSLTDVFGNAYGWWNFIQTADAAKVRVFNPSLEEDMWLCPHTVVNVLQRDMPFLVDSVRIEVTRRNISVHDIHSTVVTVCRDSKGQVLEVLANDSECRDTKTRTYRSEALISLEINLHTDEPDMRDLSASLLSVLNDVDLVVSDYHNHLKVIENCRSNLALSTEMAYQDTVQETDALLKWMGDGSFTFLGYSEYEFTQSPEGRVLTEVTDKRLGLFRLRNGKRAQSPVTAMNEAHFNGGMTRFHLSTQLVSFTKSAVRSRVHRHAYSDYVVVKRFDKDGKVCGESRFLGLYTSPVYTLSPSQIPLIRLKVAHVLERSGLEPQSHDGKALRQILETFPRDELFQSSESELLETVMGVANIKERHRVCLFVRRDPYRKFLTALVYVPRDDFSTQVRQKIQRLIGRVIQSEELEFNSYFSESLLARTHIVFKVDPARDFDIDVDRLQQQIVEITRSWNDCFYDSLCEIYGEEQGARLQQIYGDAFPSSYKESFEARAAVKDLGVLETLNNDNDLAMSFYQTVGADKTSMRFKVFHLDSLLELSDAIPVLENLGLRVIGEHPYRIKLDDNRRIWIQDFDLKFALQADVDVHSVRNNFQEAFAAIWKRRTVSDPFNRLVLGARLDWREVSVLRAYAAYMKQTLFNFSQTYIAKTLATHLDITRNLVALFKSCFDPRVNRQGDKDSERIERLKQKIIDSLDRVDNLNEDRIVRRYLEMITGTLRTNFFQLNENSEAKDYISLKFSTRDIPNVPEPRPLYEIFVYSPRMEGVHLRGGAVARGGLRWSDRLQDYRTEVLGLVKAQQVKNAVIVPSGAKGGFVAKNPPSEGGRDAYVKEGIACYQIFIRGLLDVTDNIIDGKIKPPESVVRMDGDDPYLVVAADKGTATFSDIANDISLHYNHWLGDAFASGGSQGYDHKGMGITAKGAWVSVQRHFKEKGINVQNEDFTVIGVGDMAGDVFGNGMLMSEHICLTAAFNHLHIFVDPNPDSAASFKERQRLFNTPRLSWDDYEKSLISKGGGVFSRAAKSISISAEMKQRFDISADKLTPNELISALLKAPVDLIWNGGIGTYVKSQKESHGDVGDKANDSLRVDGNELRCKVFGEGGNLGMTQLGRIEFCLQGGSCNTDFIDNAAGVDCSDHEVNIKILLDKVVTDGDMTAKQRNKLLEEMTDSVSQLVLSNNYKQTQAISLAEQQSTSRVNEYRRFINHMVDNGHLNRKLEFLPGDDEILERQQQGKSLTRPELSVLISYAKVNLKEVLADELLTDDAYMMKAVESAFPTRLLKQYRAALYDHHLRKEIVATQVANDMINYMGINFAHRLSESTGASPIDVAKAYVTARDVYRLHDYFERVEALDYEVESQTQYHIMQKMMRRLRRATRWFLRNRRGYLSPGTEVDSFKEAVQELLVQLPDIICGVPKDEWQQNMTALTQKGIPDDLASLASLPVTVFSALNIVDAARTLDVPPELVAKVYFALGDVLGLGWFANQVSDVKVETYWQAMAREAFLDDIESQMRTLSISIIRLGGEDLNIESILSQWMEQHRLLVGRWRTMVTELQGAAGTDYAMLSVALRELLDLAQASQHCQSLDDDSSPCLMGGSS